MNAVTGACLMLLCGLGQPPSAGSHTERHAPLTLANVPDWVRAHCEASQRLRIALIGCAPDLQDARLRSDDGVGFRLISPLTSVEYKPSREDTELLIWLRAAWPLLTIWAIPGDPSKPAMLEEQLHSTVRQWGIEGADGNKPDVLIVQHSLASSILRHSPRFEHILAECWRIGCLPIVVRDETGDGRAIPGMLAISVVTQRALDSGVVAEAREYAGGPVSLFLSQQCLTGVSEFWGGNARAATAYLALVSAALPVKEAPAILERASLICLVSPVFKHEPSSRHFYRVLDPVAATSATGKNFFLVDRLFDWEERVGDDKSVSTVADAFHKPDEDKRRILAGTRGETRLRHLASLAELTRLSLITLVRSSPNAIAVFRSGAEVKPGFLNHTFSLLATQTSKENTHLPLTSFAGDAKIQVRAASRE
jgi:hypothetical protein